jgi:hypothetical protein
MLRTFIKSYLYPVRYTSPQFCTLQINPFTARFNVLWNIELNCEQQGVICWIRKINLEFSRLKYTIRLSYVLYLKWVLMLRTFIKSYLYPVRYTSPQFCRWNNPDAEVSWSHDIVCIIWYSTETKVVHLILIKQTQNILSCW